MQRPDDQYGQQGKEEAPDEITVVYYEGAGGFVTANPNDPADMLFPAIIDAWTKGGPLRFVKNANGEVTHIHGTQVAIEPEHLRFINNLIKDKAKREERAAAIVVDDDDDEDADLKMFKALQRNHTQILSLSKSQKCALDYLLNQLLYSKPASMMNANELVEIQTRTTQLQMGIAAVVIFRYKETETALKTKGEPKGFALKLFSICAKNRGKILCDQLMDGIEPHYPSLSVATLKDAVELISYTSSFIQFKKSYADADDVNEYLDYLGNVKRLDLDLRNSFGKNESVVRLIKVIIAICLVLDNSLSYYGGEPSNAEVNAHRNCFRQDFLTYYYIAECVVNYEPFAKGGIVAALRKSLHLEKAAPNQDGPTEVPLEAVSSDLYDGVFRSKTKPESTDWNAHKFPANLQRSYNLRLEAPLTSDAAPPKVVAASPPAAPAAKAAPAQQKAGAAQKTGNAKSGGGNQSAGGSKPSNKPFGPEPAKPGKNMTVQELNELWKSIGATNRERKSLGQKFVKAQRASRYDVNRSSGKRRQRAAEGTEGSESD